MLNWRLSLPSLRRCRSDKAVVLIQENLEGARVDVGMALDRALAAKPDKEAMMTEVETIETFYAFHIKNS